MTVTDSKDKTPGWTEYLSSYWNQEPTSVPDRETLAFCTVDQLRQYSESLTTAVTAANTKISQIESKLKSANDTVQQVFTEAMAKDAIAYDKLQELSNKAYDIKHSIFSTIPDGKQYAASCFPSDPLAPSKKTSWDHYDTLGEEIDNTCAQPASEEAITAIDVHISKLIFLTHKLSMRKLSMLRELCLQGKSDSNSFQAQKEILEGSFAKRDEQFQAIHSTLLQSKEKLTELCFEEPKEPELDQKQDEPPSFYASYIVPAVKLMKSRTYATGFETQPNNIFHKLITEYILAKEAAQQSLGDYQQQCDGTFKIFQEHELAKNERSKFIETKQYIESLIQQKAHYLLPGQDYHPNQTEHSIIDDGHAGNFNGDT